MHAAVPPFAARVRQEGVQLRRAGIDTVQINVGKLCNQACAHCHIDAGPKRTEIMDRRTAELALEFVRAAGAWTVDLTGGAPELNLSFRFLVEQARHDDRHVIDRCNLTVLSEPGQEDLPQFLAGMGVEITASLPCYLEENVNRQRGRGVYEKSIQALLCLNAVGYGQEGSGLVLNSSTTRWGHTCRLPRKSSKPTISGNWALGLASPSIACTQLPTCQSPASRVCSSGRANSRPTWNSWPLRLTPPHSIP
jgi:radical SAM/Cys-rich protein